MPYQMFRHAIMTKEITLKAEGEDKVDSARMNSKSCKAKLHVSIAKRSDKLNNILNYNDSSKTITPNSKKQKLSLLCKI